MNYKEVQQDVFITNDAYLKADALIFDCDGTLIDITSSYNACIKYTVGFFLNELIGKPWYDYVNDELIQILRASGGFNNDIDTCYACILLAVANHSDLENSREFAKRMALKADARGIISIEEALNGYDLKHIKEILNYPSKDSILAKKFDEFFYGKLFKEIYGVEGSVEHGFIEYDKVIIKDETIDSLRSKFNDKLAIVSGRSKVAMKYTLKDMLNKFNLDASVFIEDEERVGNKIGKPSPYPIIRSMDKLKVNRAIYIGDSVEDLLMVRNANRYGYNISFIGVYENGLDPQRQLFIFKELKADGIIRNVNLLPLILNTF